MTFVAERRIYTSAYDAGFLETKFNIVERLYNDGVSFCIGILKQLATDVWYRKALEEYRHACTEKEKAFWCREVFCCAEAYGLTEYGIHAYLGQGKVSGYNKGIGINIVQKTGTQLWASVKKALFGKKIHFRKHGFTSSFEDKKASSGIIYKGPDSVTVMGQTMDLKPVRKNDTWITEALSHKVKYCRIIRRPCGKHYRYFLQIVLDGEPPMKHCPGTGTTGIDPGVSTMAVYNGKELSFLVLAPDIGKYQEAVFQAQKRYSRLMQVNNPDCFRDDGTYIKGRKIKHTSSMEKAVMELKTAFRKQAVYVRQQNRRMCNRILEEAGSILKIEKMDYRALQKRSSKTQRRTKLSEVKTSSGAVKLVHKYKRKKRFGKSILSHSPADFIAALKEKISACGGAILEVDTWKYRASQYDHTDGSYTKYGLNSREKEVGGHLVQRDCYSSFLLYHAKNELVPDRESCAVDFKNFLDCQKKLIDRLKPENFSNPNFGTKLFA